MVLGLIGGNGSLPLELAIAARRQGFTVVVAAVGDEMAPSLEQHADIYAEFCPGSLGAIISYFKEHGIKRYAMAGKVSKESLYKGLPLDERFLSLLAKIKDVKDDTLMLGLAGEFESEGMVLENQTTLLESFIPSCGCLTNGQPTEAQWRDIEFGFSMAKHIGAVDIGQTVVVKRRAVMAVEAIEGTDECVKRGGTLARDGAVVVKVAKPMQDFRFDVPAIGAQTIRTMGLVDAKVLAVEAGVTFLLERDEVLSLANDLGIVIVATDGHIPQLPSEGV